MFRWRCASKLAPSGSLTLTMNSFKVWDVSTVLIKSGNISEEIKAEIPNWALSVFCVRKRVCVRTDTFWTILTLFREAYFLTNKIRTEDGWRDSKQHLHYNERYGFNPTPPSREPILFINRSWRQPTMHWYVIWLHTLKLSYLHVFKAHSRFEKSD